MARAPGDLLWISGKRSHEPLPCFAPMVKAPTQEEMRALHDVLLPHLQPGQGYLLVVMGDSEQEIRYMSTETRSIAVHILSSLLQRIERRSNKQGRNWTPLEVPKGRKFPLGGK